LATVPFSPGRGSYYYAFAQTAHVHLVVAALNAGVRGPEAGIFLDCRAARQPGQPARPLIPGSVVLFLRPTTRVSREVWRANAPHLVVLHAVVRVLYLSRLM